MPGSCLPKPDPHGNGFEKALEFSRQITEGMVYTSTLLSQVAITRELAAAGTYFSISDFWSVVGKMQFFWRSASLLMLLRSINSSLRTLLQMSHAWFVSLAEEFPEDLPLWFWFLLLYAISFRLIPPLILISVLFMSYLLNNTIHGREAQVFPNSQFHISCVLLMFIIPCSILWNHPNRNGINTCWFQR